MLAPIANDSLVGFVLADKYRVLRQIGRGGMGVVYEAEHVGLGKRVAVKLMLEKYADDTEAIARFQREALAASRIGNPHIIDVSDIGVGPDGRSFVVMELLNGLPLSRVIEMTGPLPAWRAVQIMRQVLRAVGAAHAKGIVHRDLKPDNIFILSQDDHHDFVKLLDFGISKVMDPDEQLAMTKLTTTGVVMGTPLYMAPEQAMGHPIDHQVDVYACGVILYEMLAGRPPFEGATYAVLVAKLLTSPPPPLGEVRPGLPAALVRATHHALEKEPANRFASAEQFLAALPADTSPSQLELAGTLDSSSGVAAAAAPLTEKRVRRRWPVIAGALAIVVAAAGATVLLLKDDAPAAPTSTPGPAAVADPAPAAPAPADPAPADLAPAAAPPPAAAAVGILHVKSVPSGALVMLDGVAVGVTPIEITLEPRRYRVKVALDGYDAIESDEDVRARERASVLLQLRPAPRVSGTRRGDKKAPVRAAEPIRSAAPIRPTAPATPDLSGRAVDPADTAAKPPKTVKPAGSSGTKPNPY